MVTVHHLSIISGQEYRMPVRLVDAAGHAVPIADYDLYGAARRGAETTRMSVAVVDGSSCIIIIPPLEQASYTYDLYLRHRSTTAEVQLMAGNIAVRGRVASMPPATGGGEDVVAVVSADMTEVQVTVTPIAVATPEAWDRLDRAGDLLADAIETAGALVPDAQRVIRQEVETGQSTITEASADAVRQAGADIAAAGDREVASAAARIRTVSGEEADAIAAAGEAARQDVVAAGSSATSESLAVIDAATTAGTGAINSSINSGVNAIGQSITAGTSEIQAAVTSGTGTISDATASGKSSIDTYVLTTQADLARKSTANIWSGVNTFNAPVVLNDSATLASSNVFGADIFARRYRINNLIDGCILAERLAPRDITYGTDWWWQASDSSTQRYSISGQYAMVAKPSAVGAWRSSYLVTGRYFTAVERVKPGESNGERTTRIGIFAIRPRINARSGEMPNVSSAAVQIGFMCFFTSHSDSYPFPVTKRPWDWPIFEPPHHGNWSQINGVDVCEAYGHDIPSICVCCGYGGGIRDADGIEYNARPCIRYKSPVSSAADVVAFYVSSDHNDQLWFNTGIKSYIELADGSTIEFYGQFIGQRYSDLGCRAVPRDGKQTNLSIKSVALYPNVRPLEYYKGNVDISAPIHPIEDYLRDRKSYSIARPSKTNYLGTRISIAYTPHSAERHPCDYRMYAPGDPLSYGAQITISRAAQNLMVTMPDGYIIDVDHWSRDWCIANGKTIEIPENTTGQDRYVSVWFYSAANNNNSDGTNTILEYGITQKG